MRKLLRALLEEGAAVAEAMGVTLSVSIDRRLEAGLAVGDHKTSMLQDFEAGKALESDARVQRRSGRPPAASLNRPRAQPLCRAAKRSGSRALLACDVRYK
jgi:hypothetical protein